MTAKKLLLLLISFILGIILVGCKTVTPTLITTAPAGETEVATEVAQATVTLPPTETTAPATVLLYLPESASSENRAGAQSMLEELAGQNGLLLEVTTTFDAAQLGAQTRVVVLLDENGIDAAALAQRYPAIPFIVFRQQASSAEQPANLVSFIADPAYLNFAAGFLSILIAPDWRLGAVLPLEGEDSGAAAVETFTNGAAYHCGRCASTYMPVALFPVTTALPSASSPEAWIEAITTLDNQYYLYTVYVAPEAASEALYAHLVTQNVTVVGSRRPEGIDGLLWAASINQDRFSALRGHWAAIISGSLAENQIIVPVVLSEINEEYLSPGRVRMFEEMLDTLNSGFLLPYSPDYP